jgi:hypothetical protein
MAIGEHGAIVLPHAARSHPMQTAEIELRIGPAIGIDQLGDALRDHNPIFAGRFGACCGGKCGRCCRHRAEYRRAAVCRKTDLANLRFVRVRDRALRPARISIDQARPGVAIEAMIKRPAIEKRWS